MNSPRNATSFSLISSGSRAPEKNRAQSCVDPRLRRHRLPVVAVRVEQEVDHAIVQEPPDDRAHRDRRDRDDRAGTAAPTDDRRGVIVPSGSGSERRRRRRSGISFIIGPGSVGRRDRASPTRRPRDASVVDGRLASAFRGAGRFRRRLGGRRRGVRPGCGFGTEGRVRSTRNERWTSSFARRSSARLRPSEREISRTSSAGSGSEAGRRRRRRPCQPGPSAVRCLPRPWAPPSRRAVALAELPFGGSSSRLTWIVRLTSSCALRSSRRPRPIERPSVGRRCGPTTIRAMTRMIKSSCGPMFSISSCAPDGSDPGEALVSDIVLPPRFSGRTSLPREPPGPA